MKMNKTLLLLAGYGRTGTTSLWYNYLNQPFKAIDGEKDPRYLINEPTPFTEIIAKKSMEQYVDDYVEFLDREENKNFIAVDFSGCNHKIDPKELERLAEYSKGRLEIKVLLSLRHPIDRMESVYYKQMEKILRQNLPINKKTLDPYQFIDEEINYERTYNLFNQYFPIVVIDGIQYCKTFYRKKELSELIGYELPDLENGNCRNKSLFNRKFKNGKLDYMYEHKDPEFTEDYLQQKPYNKVIKQNYEDRFAEGGFTNQWNAIVAAKYSVKYREDIETWKRLCF